MIMTDNSKAAQAIIEEILFGSSQNLEMMIEKADMDNIEDEETVYKKANQTTSTTVVSARDISIARRKMARRKAARKNRFRIEEKRNPFYKKPRRERRMYEMSYEFDEKKSRLNDVTLARALEEYYDDVSCKAEIEEELQEAERMRKKMLENLKLERAFRNIALVAAESDIEKFQRLLEMEELEEIPGEREFIKRKLEFTKMDLIKLRKRLSEIEVFFE